jgi:rod shape-determining protein MreD
VTRVTRYFARAEFAIDWPIQFLVGVTGVLLTFFEGSLALWSLFYGATPLLSLVFLYWMMVQYENFVSVFLVFVIGLISDILFSDILGGRATAYVLAFYYVGFRRAKILQGDFMQTWLDFALVVTGVMLFQLLIFSLLNFAIPAVTPILFQIGSTLILFPMGYLLLFSLASLVEKVRMLS